MAQTPEIDLAVELAPSHPKGLRLVNPVMVASGTFGWDGYGSDIPDGVDFQRLGAIVAKTVTMSPREGNPYPRLYPESWKRAWQAGECIYLNSVGLANPGIHTILKEKASLWTTWKVPVILSIAGESSAQFAEMAAIVEGTPGIAALELNLSCPNVDSGAQFSHDSYLAYETMSRVKASTSLPVFAKLSPNVPNIAPIAEAVVGAGADAITLTNTIPAMAIGVDELRPVLGAVTGGLSGPALRPIAVGLVHRAAQVVDVPIIGVGGVYTAHHALEFIIAGAWAVQIGSANLANFWAPLEVVDGLKAYMIDHGIVDLSHVRSATQKERSLDGSQGPR